MLAPNEGLLQGFQIKKSISMVFGCLLYVIRVNVFLILEMVCFYESVCSTFRWTRAEADGTVRQWAELEITRTLL